MIQIQHKFIINKKTHNFKYYNVEKFKYNNM